MSITPPYFVEEDLLINEVEEWIAALESGNYRQTTGKLRDGNCFCCLGVLSDLQCGWAESPNDYKEKAVPYHSYLPSRLINKFHLNKNIEGTEAINKWLANYGLENEPIFNRKNVVDLRLLLVILNDSGKLTFKDIADFLRQFYLPLIKGQQV